MASASEHSSPVYNRPPYSNYLENYNPVIVPPKKETNLPRQPSPPPIATTLAHAIDTAPAKQLRILVKDYIKTNSAAEDIATQRLMSSIPGASSRKRKVFGTCAKCWQDYQVTDNEHGVCRYHTSSKDPDLEEHFLDVYEDWEMPDPGDPDPENQEGFFWSCCSGNGLSQGCTIARHVPALPETKFMKPAKDLDRIVWRDGRQYD